MGEQSLVNDLYESLYNSATLISSAEKVTYLEALHMTGVNIFEGSVAQTKLKEELEPMYKVFTESEGLTSEQVRKAFQLAVLREMRKGLQPNHQMTPDSIAMFMGYILEQLAPAEPYTLLDPAVGTANLMTAMMNSTQHNATGMGVDVDETLIRLAYTNANLQQLPVELTHQDSLRPLLLSPADVTVSDLPIGYYPDEEIAKTFKTGAHEPYYSPFLLIEQALNYTKPDGYLMFLIPNELFGWDKHDVLRKLLLEEAHILGLLQLPVSLFKEEQQGRSLLILQKKGPDGVKPEQALMASLPDFSNPNKMASILPKINQWFEDYKSKRKS